MSFPDLTQSEILADGTYVMYIARRLLKCLDVNGGFIPCRPTAVNEFFTIKYALLEAYVRSTYLSDVKEELNPDQDTYLCNFNGNCEPVNRSGSYKADDCRKTCTSTPYKDLVYEIMMYAPDRAVELAPSDQVVVIKRLTGVTVAPEYAFNIVLALADDSYAPLCYHSEMLEYANETYADPVVKALGEVRFILGLEFDVWEVAGEIEQRLMGVERTAENVSEMITEVFEMVKFEREWFVVNTVVRGYM